MNTQIKLIEIDIDDNRVYAQIAFLVDSLTFLDLVVVARQKFHIKEVFAPGDYENWKNHILLLAGFDLKEYWEMNKISPDITKKVDRHWKKKSKWLKDKEENFIGEIAIEKDFLDTVARIRKLHHYPPLFDSIISQAILFHRIVSFETAQERLLYNNLPITNYDNDASMAILISPASTKKDVMKAFNNSRKNLKKEFAFANSYDKKLDKDTLSKIRTTRIWHWKQLNGMTYEQISDEWNKQCPNQDMDGEEHDKKCKYCIKDTNKVEQYVARYRRNLQTIVQKTDI